MKSVRQTLNQSTMNKKKEKDKEIYKGLKG